MQDNEDRENGNTYQNIDLLDGAFAADMEMHYCTMLSADPALHTWSAGEYCLAKVGPCPEGFFDGSIFWDDEDDDNGNWVGGAVPDGEYGRTNTRIKYCCRDDGDINRNITQPYLHDFVIYPYHSKRCQAVEKMRSEMIRILSDDQDSRNADSCAGAHPYDEGCDDGDKDHDIYLCYYEKAE